MAWQQCQRVGITSRGDLLLEDGPNQLGHVPCADVLVCFGDDKTINQLLVIETSDRRGHLMQ